VKQEKDTKEATGHKCVIRGPSKPKEKIKKTKMRIERGRAGERVRELLHIQL
jgi:hypothetical protein